MKVFSEGYPSDFLRIASSFWVRGVVFEKVESLEKDGESIKIKCIGFATKGIN